VRVFGAEERELDRYSVELRKVSRLKRAMALYAGGFYSMLYLGINLITLVICGFGGLLVSNGELTRGGIAQVVTQVQILERSMAKMSVVSAQLFKAFRSSAHVFEMIHEVPVVNTASGGKALRMDARGAPAAVSFAAVGFSYPSRPDVRVLDDFSLRVDSGHVVAIVGPSGSGKSTLSALLSRLYDVEQGAVTIDGVDVRDLEPESLHEVVGIVSQQPTLFSCSVRDNIRYGKPDATDLEVQEAARAANAHDFISAFPKGYDTELGERGVLLSGGQRQRLAIARVILRDPALLILDEATSALDNESERYVQEALDKLMATKKRTTIVIAHRLSTVRNADSIVVLSKGRVVERGSHNQLMAANGVYARLYNMQVVDTAEPL
jgi:ATP-binding cassette subfamily B (MDR/TAP) protein 8